MDSLRFDKVLREIEKIKKPQDLLKITTFNGEEITGILLEKIPYRSILDDGFDTDDKPTKLKIRSLNNENPEFDNKELIISIFQIHKVQVLIV